MANSNGWGDGASNNTIGWGQGANNTIGWGDSHLKSWAGLTDISGFDSSAISFFNATGITNTTQQDAIDNLVRGLKDDGIWNKMKAIYPFVGGTATTHKFNLKDPRDVDAAYRIVFNGGWTHSRNGAQPNGTNGFAETFFNPVAQSLPINDTHFSIYSRTNNITTNVMIGNYSGGGFNQSNIFSFIPLFVRINSTNTATTITNTDILGLITASRISGTQTTTYKNTTAYLENNPSTAISNNSYRLGGNVGIQPNLYDSNQYAFSTIGNGLTDTEAANLYTRVQAFQTALSRQV